MKFLRKVGKKLGFIEKDKTDKIMDERNDIKKVLINNMKAMNFTNAEINEVLAIIKKAEDDVQVQKDALIGTNINNPDPNPIMKEKFDEIRRIQLQSGEDLDCLYLYQ